MDALLALEQIAGRERLYVNAPRTLDLDLLLYGDARVSSPRLTLPHPRWRERAFVLYPMADLIPDSVTTADFERRGSLTDLSGCFNLVFKIPLKTESQAGHQDRCANQQSNGNTAYRGPIGLAGFSLWMGLRIELGIPFFGWHQTINNGVEGAT
eukprot:gene16737-22710_t